MRIGDKTNTGVEAGGNDQKVAPGRYHVEVTAAYDKTDDPDKAFTLFELTVRAGTDAAMVNKVHHERCNWYNNNETAQSISQDRILLMAYQTGVVTREEAEAKKKAGEDIHFDWDKAIGKHLVVEIEEREDKKTKGKFYRSIKPQEIYLLEDPRVADVPKDDHAAQMAEVAQVF